jgi:ACT domain-containing protein
MKVNADIRLKDVPGQLIKALEPISLNDGNIVGVIHDHEQVTGGRIAVNVTFEAKDQQRIDAVVATWKERGVEVVKMDEIVRTFSAEYLLVGDLSRSTLRSITDKLEKMVGVDTIDLQYSLSTSTDNKSVLLLVNVRDKARMKDVDDLLKGRSKRDDFLLVRGMGV